MNCELDFFSYQTNPANFQVPRHTHSCYELVYYISGQGTSDLENQKYTYQDHSFALIPPNTYHTEATTEETSMIYFGFKYEGPSIQIEGGIYSDKDDNHPILALVEQMKDEVLNQHQHYNLMLNSLISQILIKYERQFNRKKAEKDNSFSYIVNFINENYYTQIDPRALADIACLSYDRFRHRFKDITGFSPFGYIIQTRLKNAKHQLQYTDATITEIALNCGFPTASQFSSLFKERYNISPKDYRNSKQKE